MVHWVIRDTELLRTHCVFHSVNQWTSFHSRMFLKSWVCVLHVKVGPCFVSYIIQLILFRLDVLGSLLKQFTSTIHSHLFFFEVVCSPLTSWCTQRCSAAAWLSFHSFQKQLHSPLHNSIIFSVQKHVPEASPVSSSSSSDNLSAGDMHSHLSSPRIRK